MNGRESLVRAAFEDQAQLCARFGSSFMSVLCRTIGANLDDSSLVGRRIVQWTGDPSARGDAVPLRLAGGLHALVLRGGDQSLAALYLPERHEPRANRGAHFRVRALRD